MDRTPEELINQIWFVEEDAGIEHYLQTREEFVKQMSFKSIDELQQRLHVAEKELAKTATEQEINELIQVQFESCRENFNIQPANEMYDGWDFWYSKYSKLIPTAYRDGIIKEEEVLTLLETAGDYFGAYITEEEFNDKWLPYNALLERVG